MSLSFLRMPKKPKFSKSFQTRFLRSKGFTLIEIMVTVAILSFGILAIYESFFISLDTYNYYADYLNAQSWIGEKIWELQNQLMQKDAQVTQEDQGTFSIINKNFNWNTRVETIDEESGVYRLNISLFWKEGSKDKYIYRVAYAVRQFDEES
jgi:prepilin-type N-terminal cleavage/methylation domain-containing protein